MRCFYLILGFLTGWQTVTAQTLTPAQIFAKTIAVYKSAATYQDTGEVLRYTKDNNPGWFEPSEFKERITFQTAFVRKTGQWRFQFQKLPLHLPPNCYLIWSNGAQTKTWWSLTKELTQEQTLEDGLAPAAGISGGSSIRVPDLLLGGKLVAYRGINDLDGIVYTPVDKQSGKTFYHIKGTWHIKSQPGMTGKVSQPAKEPTADHPFIDVWIDATTFLIVRITKTYNEGSRSHRETTVYQPILNKPVSPSALTFDTTKCP